MSDFIGQIPKERHKAAPRRGEVPSSPSAEMALVAAIMLDERQAWDENVHGFVSPDDFFTDEYRWVYQAELWLREHGDPVTIPTVAWALSELGHIDDVDARTGGTEPFLGHLCAEWMLSAWGCSRWAKMIRTYAQAREQIRLGAQIARDGYAGKITTLAVTPLYERDEYAGAVI